jgi:enolase
VWNSAGLPTLEVEIELADGSCDYSIAQSGMSGGYSEPIQPSENLCSNARASLGKVLHFCNKILAPQLIGQDPTQQKMIDALLRKFWHQDNLSHAQTAAISIAVAKVAAKSRQMPLWQYLKNDNDPQIYLPMPEVEIIGGGAHANMYSDIQDIMVICPGALTYEEALYFSGEVYHRVRASLSRKGRIIGVCEKGGLWPDYQKIEEAMDIVAEAIAKTSLSPGRDIGIAIDFAANTYYKNNHYCLRGYGNISSEEMVSTIIGWIRNYPIMSIEDPLSSKDKHGYITLMESIGDQVQVVGDDLYDSNAVLIADKDSHKKQLCNAILLKPAKAGTLTDTIDALLEARNNDWGVILAGRAGDNEDTAVMHIAVGLDIGQFKIGALARSERACKFNEGIRICERNLKAGYAAYQELPKLVGDYGLITT